MANVFVYGGADMAADTLADHWAWNAACILSLSEEDYSIQCSKQMNTTQSTNKSAAIFNIAIGRKLGVKTSLNIG